MATLTVSGIGSGLDLDALISRLVAADRAPREAQIARRESAATVQISALATLKNALSTFRSALEPLQEQDGFTPRTATTSDPAVVTATATNKAAIGTYDIEVVALAQAHQLASEAFAEGSSSVVGTGTLTISVGAASFSITIDETNHTLAGIRDAINADPDNTGVQATLINETNGTRLVLTSTETGLAYSIQVSSDLFAEFTELKAAQDAHIRIAGFDHYASTNSVSEAIEGVTLELLKTTANGETLVLTVGKDTALLIARVNQFVSSYNALYKTFSQLRSYNAATRQAGPMLGDALLRGIEMQLGTALSSPVGGVNGDYTSLASIGITRKADGTLALDSTRFESALNASPGAVAAIFGSDDGVANRLASVIDARIETGGVIDTRSESLQRTLARIQDEKAALDARMERLEASYRAQFTALDALLAQLQTTANYLTQQLANLPKPGSMMKRE